MKKDTKLVHFNHYIDDIHNPNSVPIYQTATFSQITADAQGSYDYSRSGNPTRTILEKHLAQLENAKFAFAFTSGMAAISAITRLLKTGDHIIASIDVYGGTHRLFNQILSKQGIKVDWVDARDIECVSNSITSKTRLIWVETPSNPLQQIIDIRRLSKLTRSKGILLAVDNSLLSSWLQQPLSLRADIVIQSATKHLSGHSDLTGGVVAVNNSGLAESLAFIQNAEGTGLAPFECWLLLRGVQTLGIRLERQQKNATILSEFLSRHPLTKGIYYPGLSSHPGYEIHKQQAAGPGTIISFETGSIELSKHIVEATQLFSISVSFGNVKSLISLPSSMSHASSSKITSHLPADLIRLSIGIEDVTDLISDLEQAFTIANEKIKQKEGNSYAS